LSQRGVQPRGKRRLATTMSASRQARVRLFHSMRSRLRMASKRHARPLRITSTTQASRLQRAKRCSSSDIGSPSKADASLIRLRT
jgi:hypothetical protein